MNNAEEAVRRFCECFNTQRFYEAHDVLEAIWLPVRKTVEGNLWKGCIQLAAAFVHVQKGRPDPAVRLLRSSRQLLRPFLSGLGSVDISQAFRISKEWEAKICIWKSGPKGLSSLLQEESPELNSMLNPRD